MDKNKQLIDQLLATAQLPALRTVRHLGVGELNNSYYVLGEDGHEYCVRIAKYKGKSGLRREADALSRLPEGISPRLVFKPVDEQPLDTLWLIESFLTGTTPQRLTLAQLGSFGRQLARVHSIDAPDHDIVDKGEVTGVKNDLWPYLVWCCRSFYTEDQMLHKLPDKRLLAICRKARQWFEVRKPIMQRQQTKKLLHKDITFSNLLIQDDKVFIIDWELRDFGDPMVDFATGFWNDIEFNRGKWRTVLTTEEKTALYDGYQQGGGVLDEERIAIFTTYDKLGAAIFLCYRLYSPPADITPQQTAQYQEDFDNIITSLQKHIH